MKESVPQANDLDRVIDILKYIYFTPNVQYSDIAEYIDFSERQAKYYVQACSYLGLVTPNLRPTPLCQDIFRNNLYNIHERIFELIITDEVMGQIFARAYIFPEYDIDTFAKEVVTSYYPNLTSDVTIARRAHIIVLWVKRIITYMTLKHK